MNDCREGGAPSTPKHTPAASAASAGPCCGGTGSAARPARFYPLRDAATNNTGMFEPPHTHF